MAYEGIIFERNYVQPSCTPSRSALMTGMYPYKIGRQVLNINMINIKIYLILEFRKLVYRFYDLPKVSFITVGVVTQKRKKSWYELILFWVTTPTVINETFGRS